MPESPTKRRKTSTRSFRSQSYSKMIVPVKQFIATWPAGIIPMEIFSLVISFLTRSDVQNMRLVNREFEEKVAHDLFQTVVVPFSSEIYGIAQEPTTCKRYMDEDDREAAPENVAVMLQDQGMRVFQGFGRHIHRFGMSFEFDYHSLIMPPTKSDQEAITTFWGIYRWPFKKYNRYHQLEGLEQAADETRTMTKALRFITNSKELALSIDGGLGWLTGPDCTANKEHPTTDKPVVFGESRFRPEEKPSPESFRPPSPAQPLIFPFQLQKSFMVDAARETRDGRGVSAFVQMLREAGYEGFDLTQSVRTLAEILHVPVLSLITGGLESLIRGVGHQVSGLDRIRSALTHALIADSDAPSPQINNHYPLKPNDLTIAQKEMLLEIEWAQRAFMQSYAIAIIDNPTTFQGVETLSIARLPSRHLAILRRDDFWASLSHLRKFSLAIIPDWREVVKLPTSWVDDVRVPASQAIVGVYQLLQDHIAPRKSITTLHFEWLCGGEEGTGLFARNQLILAAPVVRQAIDMVTGSILQVPVLDLPYVEHLSLKNCWISPHIMVRFVGALKKQALKTLILQSASLSAPAPRNRQPAPVHIYHPQHNPIPQVGPIAQAQAIGQAVQVQAHQAAVAQAFAATFHMQQATIVPPQIGGVQHQGQGQIFPVAPSQPTLDPISWLNPPRFESWAHVIDQISPGETLAGLLYARDLGPEPPNPEGTQLTRINFNSCGYVRLLLDFDQSILDPPNQGPADTHAIAKRRSEIEQYMMKPQEHTLGIIVNYIGEEEINTLQTTWNLRVGWGKSGKILAAQALADGSKAPGQGRFRGTIEAKRSFWGELDLISTSRSFAYVSDRS